MSNLDLSAAIEAAAVAVHVNTNHSGMTGQPDFCVGPPFYQRDTATVAVAAAAPLIEAAVREQIVVKIVSLWIGHVSSLDPIFDDGFTSACGLAERIARGEPS